MAFQEDGDEKPLDPAVLRVQARLRGLMLVAGGTLGLGLLAVMFAIVYRIATLDDSSEGGDGPVSVIPAAPGMPPAELAVDRAAMGLSATARLVSTALDGDRALLTFEDGGALILVTIASRSGAVVGRLRIDAAR